jgi:hypothetical protein
MGPAGQGAGAGGGRWGATATSRSPPPPREGAPRLVMTRRGKRGSTARLGRCTARRAVPLSAQARVASPSAVRQQHAPVVSWTGSLGQGRLM